jgi:hypothetical protein
VLSLLWLIVPKQEAMRPQDREAKVSEEDLAGLEALAARVEPLWGALSGAIAAIEAELGKSGAPESAAAAAAASPTRMLPPGATQARAAPCCSPAHGGRPV